jgi:hypothetical protein
MQAHNAYTFFVVVAFLLLLAPIILLLHNGPVAGSQYLFLAFGLMALFLVIDAGWAKLLLLPIAWLWYSGLVANTLFWVFGLIALFLVLVARWTKRKTDIVRVVRPYRHLGLGTAIFVIGVLLILVTITAYLMGYQFAASVPISWQTGTLNLPGLHKLLPTVGVILMLFGLWVNQSDKYYIRLEHRI